MANNSMGYSTPNYANMGYGNYNFNPNMYNNSMSPYAQQLRNLEMQNPQYGNTMPPPINQQIPQNNQQLQGANQNQPSGFTPVAIVSTAQEASTQIPDMVSGTKSIYYDSSNDQFYMNYFDFDTGKKVFKIYGSSSGDDSSDAPKPLDSPEVASKGIAIEYITDEDVQPIRCQISGIEDELQSLKKYVNNLEKELFVDEPYGDNSNDGAARKPNGNSANASRSTNAKSNSGSTNKPNTANVSGSKGKPNAGESSGKESPTD